MMIERSGWKANTGRLETVGNFGMAFMLFFRLRQGRPIGGDCWLEVFGSFTLGDDDS